MQQRMTAAEYRIFVQQQAKKQKRNKHRNRYVYIYEDGWIGEAKDLKNHGKVVRVYASEKEFSRHKQLEILEKAGKISNLQRQVPLLLQAGFVNPEGKKVKPIYYKADFMYVQDGATVVEDVKGIDKETGKPLATEAFQIKWKLLQGAHPEYVFRIF